MSYIIISCNACHVDVGFEVETMRPSLLSLLLEKLGTIILVR